MVKFFNLNLKNSLNMTIMKLIFFTNMPIPNSTAKLIKKIILGGQQLFLAGHQGGNSLFATHNNQPSSTSNLFNSSCHQNQPGNNSLFYTAANAGTGSTNQLFQPGQATPQLNSKMIKSSRAVVSDNIPSRGESIGAGNNNACHNNRRDKRDGKGSVQFCQV